MAEEVLFTISAAEIEFAQRANGHAWELLEKADRTEDDDVEMIAAAFASLYHWTRAGTAIHRQRGEWLVSHVYAELGRAADALAHARRCLELTEAHPDEMHDFDIAYANEGIARALVLDGRREEADHYLEQARSRGEVIADPEDRTIFMDDLHAGDWHGLRP